MEQGVGASDTVTSQTVMFGLEPMKGLVPKEGATETLYLNTAVMSEPELIEHLELCRKEVAIFTAIVHKPENPKKKQKTVLIPSKVTQEHIFEDKCRQKMFCMDSFASVLRSVESEELCDLVSLAPVTPDDGEVCSCCGHGVVLGQINQECTSCGSCLTGRFFQNNTDEDIKVCFQCYKLPYPEKKDKRPEETTWEMCSRGLFDEDRLGKKKKHFFETDGRGNVMADYIDCVLCKKMCHRECALVPTSIPEEVMALKDYVCPNCLLNQLRTGERTSLPRRFAPNSPESIPPTRLALMIEKYLAAALDETGFKIVVREMCRTRGVETVPADAAALYDAPPPDMPYYERVLFYFAVDKRNPSIVYLPFIVFAAEFDDTGGAANPNRGLVYVKYIDSAKHTGNNIRIKTLYAAYLNSVVRRGFRRIMKWVFPAQDLWFIFAFPPPRRMMTVPELHEWYRSVMRTEQDKGTIGEERGAYDNMTERDGKMCMGDTPWVTGDALPEHFQQHRDENKAVDTIKRSNMFVRLWDIHSGPRVDDMEGETFTGCATFKNNNTIQQFLKEKGGNDVHPRRVMSAYEVISEMLSNCG